MFDKEREVQIPENSADDKETEKEIQVEPVVEGSSVEGNAAVKLIGIKRSELDVAEFPEDHPFRRPKISSTFGVALGAFKDVEMLFEPSESLVPGEFMEEVYKDSINQILREQSFDTAMKIASVGMQLMRKFNNKPFILVSLNPENAWVGIMLKRFFFTKFKMDCPHFCVGVKDDMIDRNALKYIYELYPKMVPANIQFVAYTSGNGGLSDMLTKSLSLIEEDEADGKYAQLFDDMNDDIAYICDPFGCGDIFADRFDVPSIFDVLGFFGNGTVGSDVWCSSEGDLKEGKFFRAQNVVLMKKPEDIPELPEEYKNADKIVGDITPLVYKVLTDCVTKINSQVIPLFEQNKARSEQGFEFHEINDMIRLSNLQVRYEDWPRLVIGASDVTRALMDRKLDTLWIRPGFYVPTLKAVKVGCGANGVDEMPLEGFGMFNMIGLLKVNNDLRI